MKFFAIFAILAVIASSESLGLEWHEENINDNRIFGGKTARHGQFPYMASLRYPSQENGTRFWRHLCGGGILSSRWIVSCAHCTDNVFSNTSFLAIVVGAHHISNDGQIYRLDRIVKHPAYVYRQFRNDITLLRTIKSLQFNAFVQSIPLRKHFVDADAAAIISGWGDVQGSNPRPTHLQYLAVSTLTNDECLTRINNVSKKFVYEGTLCAFARNRQGICFSDSGSPLVANGQIIGLAGWISGWQCGHGYPDGYTRISVFLTWIREVSGIEAV